MLDPELYTVKHWNSTNLSAFFGKITGTDPGTHTLFKLNSYIMYIYI